MRKAEGKSDDKGIVGSRDVAETAIEKAKRERGAIWEKPATRGRAFPKWGSDELDRSSIPACGDRT
jgi:hypothetical protein